MHPEVLVGLFVFILGLIIGSFLNVVILRYRTGRKLSGRSKCFSCGQTLSWSDLLPVLSFVFSFGRCRHCRCRVSWQYPLVELLTGVLFLLAYAFGPIYVAGASLPFLLIKFGLLLIILSLLVVIAFYDFRHKIIPDQLVFLFALLSLVFSLFGDFSFKHLGTLLLSGVILALPFGLVWFFSRGRAMGLGDAKLVFGFGLLSGFSQALTGVILGVWLGAIYGLLGIFFQKVGLFGGRYGLTIKSEIPFGPFLIVGFLLAFFLELNFLDIALWFSPVIN